TAHNWKYVMVSAVKSPSRPKLALTLLMGAGLVWLTFSLGQWQSGRGDEKQQLADLQARALAAAPITPTAQQIDLDNLSYRKIELRGSYKPKALIYIDNRQISGKPAVQVVQAFQPEGAGFVIPVDRGLLLRNPAEPRRAPDLPVEAQTGGGLIELKGTVLPRFAQAAELRGMQLGGGDEIYREESNGFQVWSNFSLEEFSRQVNEPVSNFVVTLQPVAQVESQPRATGKVNGFYHVAVPLQEQVAKHRGYAFQWYSLSAVLVLLTLFFVYREFYRSEFYKGKKA
ncbi:MAG TPA: SURF1 family protein, partial [Limnobacter sp.]|nr:SURF1 family protein [Limnobacter sp.]